MRKDNCLDTINGRISDITKEKWKEMVDSVVANLHLAIVGLVLSSIVVKKTTKEIWDSLIKLYNVKSLHNIIFLQKRFYTFLMSESMSIKDRISALNVLFS